MIENDTLLDALKQHPIADYAPPVVRAIAAGIDLALLTLLEFIAAAFLAGALGYHTTYDIATGTETSYFLFSPVLVIALVLAYFPGLWAWRGRTPGMRLFSLRIRNADDLSPLDRTTAFFRFGWLLLAIAPALLGLLVAFSDERRQAFHDRLTGTVVVAE